MTLPTIPDLPQQPAPTLDQRLVHAGLLLRVEEYEQRERLIAANEAHTQALTRLLQDGPGTDTTMNAKLDAIAAAIAATASGGGSTVNAGSGDGLTAGDVAIVKGIVDAVRPAQG